MSEITYFTVVVVTGTSGVILLALFKNGLKFSHMKYVREAAGELLFCRGGAVVVGPRDGGLQERRRGGEEQGSGVARACVMEGTRAASLETRRAMKTATKEKKESRQRRALRVCCVVWRVA
mmetsp:Transcript_9185/g.28161  ORF Transcript_9185/g.28161 Transcript_9185/m.28161 type:complete len:121 (-) Transcript_9185:490-852(-)